VTDDRIKIGSMVGLGKVESEEDVFFIECENHRIGVGPTESRVRIYFDKDELDGVHFMIEEEGIGVD
jgi:hypothetical protein